MFNLVQRRRNYFILSSIIIALGITAMVYSLISTGSPFLLGVDFRGGTRIEVQFTEPVSEDDIRDVFQEFNVANPSVIAIQGEGLQNAWQIRSESLEAENGTGD